MIKLIFEDKGDVSISKFIRYAYNTDFRLETDYTLDINQTVWFSEGNSKMKSLLKYCNDINTKYIFFFDLVPDNDETRKALDNFMLKREKHSNKSNIIVLPIRCIEYYVIQYYLSVLDDTKLKELFQIKDYKKIKKTKNLEKYYKYLLCKEVKDCFKSKNGCYYTSDCFCQDRLEKCSPVSLRDKSEDFVRTLPLLSSFDKCVIIEEVNEKIKSLYREYIDLVRYYQHIGYIGDGDTLQVKVSQNDSLVGELNKLAEDLHKSLK